MIAPAPVRAVVRPSDSAASLAERWTNTVLLVPVFGAFFDLLWTRSVPSILWPIVLLLVAFVARLLKAPIARERDALVGADGVALEGRFVGVDELVGIEREVDLVAIRTETGERIEIRTGDATSARAEPALRALEETLTADHERDTSAEALLAELSPRRLRARAGAVYRGHAIDPARCLAALEDPAAAPRARIAAAALLAGHPDDAVRVRVAEVAGATANPELRAALEAPLRKARVAR